MNDRGTAAGVTLIELVTSIVIISIATIGLTVAIFGAVGHSADPMIEAQAGAVAQAYLEEILAAGFCDPEFDPDANAATGCRLDCSGARRACQDGCAGAVFSAESGRDQYDDVCDYDGLVDGGARNRLGAAIGGLGLYTVSVDVDDGGAQLGPAGLVLEATAGQVVRVDVEVGHPALDNPVRMNAFRANH